MQQGWIVAILHLATTDYTEEGCSRPVVVYKVSVSCKVAAAHEHVPAVLKAH